MCGVGFNGSCRAGGGTASCAYFVFEPVSSFVPTKACRISLSG